MIAPWSAPPQARLRTTFHSVWALAADAQGAVEPMVPYGCMDLLVPLRGPVWRVEGGGAAPISGPVVVGQTTRPYGLGLGPGACVVGLGFLPHTGHLAGADAARHFTDVAVPWADCGASADELDRVAEAVGRGASVAEVAGLLQRSVSDRAASVRATRAARHVAEAVRQILRGGRPEAGAVSARYVQRLFGDYVGVPPRQLGRIARFLRALPHVRRAETSLTALAHDLGYHDQAHFCREFRRFAGEPPSAWRSRTGAVGSFVDAWEGSLPYKPPAADRPTLPPTAAQ